MIHDIIIEIPKTFGYCLEIRNKLTEFLDTFKIENEETDSKYSKLLSTHIYIDKLNMYEYIKLDKYDKHLSLRMMGSTRGCLYIQEIERNIDHINPYETNISIEYVISDIKFIEDTCFGKLKVYNEDIVKSSKKELIGTKIIMNIHI